MNDQMYQVLFRCLTSCLLIHSKLLNGSKSPGHDSNQLYKGG